MKHDKYMCTMKFTFAFNSLLNKLQKIVKQCNDVIRVWPTIRTTIIRKGGFLPFLVSFVKKQEKI